MNKCYFCGHESDGKVFRNTLCLNCGKELKICLNCQFYDTAAADQCREPQAERVVDKDRSNFCDFFSPSGLGPNRSAAMKKDEAKKKLEDLFS